MTAHQIIGSAGLLFDIVGAVAVVRGIFALGDDEIAAAADRSAAWAGGPEDVNPRPALQKLFRESRRDARAGAVLLAIGFLLQIAALWV